jgi:sugar phosphate isomerase/epimerase
MTRPPIILCSGSLGSIELSQKIEAAAEAGFDGISVYGDEVRAAVEAGVDCGSLAADLGLMVAEVDGVVVTSRSTEHFDEALDIAEHMAARSITMVETRAYDPTDDRQVSEAAEVFGELCDRAALAGRLVHIEPFAWSSLGRTADAAEIVRRAGRPNGGLLFDLWHHVRGPDQGVLDDAIDVASIFEIQLADTHATAWPNTRDECMTSRLLPGHGHADLAPRLRALAARGPLAPVGVEVFGTELDGLLPARAAATALDALTSVLDAAGT